MFNFVSITTADNEPSTVLNVTKKTVGMGRMGPAGSEYILAFPALGYMTLLDVGSNVQGPGEWSVKVSGSATNWFYSGEGQATIVVDGAGNYTITGGKNEISGTLISWRI